MGKVSLVQQVPALCSKKYTFVLRNRKFVGMGLAMPFFYTILAILMGKVVLDLILSIGSGNLPTENRYLPEYIKEFDFVDALPPWSSVGNLNVQKQSGLLSRIPHRFISPGVLYPSARRIANRTLFEEEIQEDFQKYFSNGIMNFNKYRIVGDYPVLDMTLSRNASTMGSVLAEPAYLTLISEAVLTESGAPENTTSANFFYPLPMDEDRLAATGSKIILATANLYFIMGLAFSGSIFVQMIVYEKEKGLKFCLMASGCRRLSYWLSNLIVDFSIFGTAIFACIMLGVAVDWDVFTENSPLFVATTFSLFLVNILATCYMMSFIFDKFQTAIKWVQNIFAFSLVIPFLIVDLVLLGNISDGMKTVLSILPLYAFSVVFEGMQKAPQRMGGLNMGAFWETGEFGFKYQTIILLVETIVLILTVIVLDTVEMRFRGLSVKRLMEWFQSRKIRKSMRRQNSTRGNFGDDDVIREMGRCLAGGDHAVKITNLVKTFMSKDAETGKKKRIQAVDDLHLALDYGEIFGLLGPNGAGKTTTVNILCGQVSQDGGHIYVDGHPIESGVDAIHNNLGVCPQFDVLWENLSVGAHMRLFGRLRGLSGSRLEAEVAGTLKNLDLLQYETKSADKLSGGSKRKLSVGMALVGGPRVIVLDEPSTGMDPYARRGLWNIIKQLRKNHLVILTTHSMEEADAMCSRIGIMVGGRLRCIGTSQHLRSKYGSGYQIIIRCAKSSRNVVDEFVLSMFPDANRLPDIGGDLRYEVSQKTLSLSKVFKQITEKQAQFDILDFAVAQPTLRQVFIRFAREQDVDIAPNVEPIG